MRPFGKLENIHWVGLFWQSLDISKVWNRVICGFKEYLFLSWNWELFSLWNLLCSFLYQALCKLPSRLPRPFSTRMPFCITSSIFCRWASLKSVLWVWPTALKSRSQFSSLQQHNIQWVLGDQYLNHRQGCLLWLLQYRLLWRLTASLPHLAHCKQELLQPYYCYCHQLP